MSTPVSLSAIMSAMEYLTEVDGWPGGCLQKTMQRTILAATTITPDCARIATTSLAFHERHDWFKHPLLDAMETEAYGIARVGRGPWWGYADAMCFAFVGTADIAAWAAAMIAKGMILQRHYDWCVITRKDFDGFACGRMMNFPSIEVVLRTWHVQSDAVALYQGKLCMTRHAWCCDWLKISTCIARGWFVPGVYVNEDMTLHGVTIDTRNRIIEPLREKLAAILNRHGLAKQSPMYSSMVSLQMISPQYDPALYPHCSVEITATATPSHPVHAEIKEFADGVCEIEKYGIATVYACGVYRTSWEGLSLRYYHVPFSKKVVKFDADVLEWCEPPLVPWPGYVPPHRVVARVALVGVAQLWVLSWHAWMPRDVFGMIVRRVKIAAAVHTLSTIGLI